MIIDSIVLQNFRQYKGTVTFNFSTDKEKNVTVVIGQNTCGKTTLVQSFIWCLYGIVEFDQKSVLNAEIAEDLKNFGTSKPITVSVDVRLIHDDRNFIIQRSEQFEQKGYREIKKSGQSFRVYELDHTGNASPMNKEEADDLITKILPENLSKYFFFWGENIENLSKKSNLGDAVKQFLGLDVISKAIEHLEKARRRMTSRVSVNGASENSKKISAYESNIQNLEAQNSDYQNKLEGAKRNEKYYKEKMEEYYTKLTTSENKELQSKQNEYKYKNELLKEKKENLERAKEDFNDALNDSENYVYFYSNFAEEEAIKILKNSPEPVTGWNFIDLNVIEEIIKRKKCICGREFCDGDEIHKYLIKQKEIVAPNVIGGAVNSFIEEIKRRNIYNDKYKKFVKESYRKINELRDEVADLEYQVNNLSNYLSKVSTLENVQKRYQECLSKHDGYGKEIARLSTLIDTNTETINQYRRKKLLLMSKESIYNDQLKKINYCERVLNVFKNDYSKNEISLRKKLTEYVSEGFNEVYSGERFIEIDEKYNVKTKNKVGESWTYSETSPGLETVKNFAFIIGLVKCAKEKIIGSDGTKEIANKNKYPLVLDAPFSQADEKHVPAISRLIAKEADQIILVIMEKDWNYAKEALKDKVGKSYVLNKISETNTTVREVELL